MFTLQVTKRGCFNAPLLNRPFAFHRRNSRCATVLVKAGRIKSSWISTDRGETDPARIVGEMKPDIVIERRPVIWVGDRPVDPPIDCNYLVFSESTDLLRENVRSYELSGARWIVAVLGNHSIRSTSADETDHAHFRESRRRRILGKRSPGVRWCRRRSSAGINVLQPPRCGGGEQDAQQQREEQRPAPQTCPCRTAAVLRSMEVSMPGRGGWPTTTVPVHGAGPGCFYWSPPRWCLDGRCHALPTRARVVAPPGGRRDGAPAHPGDLAARRALHFSSWLTDARTKVALLSDDAS